MTTETETKEMVRQKYGEIASQAKEANASSCCGAGSCSTIDTSFMLAGEDYKSMPGYTPDADLGLGCGIPTAFSKIKPGDTVVDLGSGAGNDVFIARAQTGDTGHVIGIDMTEPMIEKARANNAKLGYANVEFRLGEIEKLPVAADKADVVISNCVLNLVPNKAKAFSEIYRILAPNGHFAISDIVLEGDLPPRILKAAEMYAGCVAGAVQKQDYLDVIVQAGFRNVSILKEKDIDLPDDILLNYLSAEDLAAYRNSGGKVKSITVSADKTVESSCCGGGCC